MCLCRHYPRIWASQLVARNFLQRIISSSETGAAVNSLVTKTLSCIVVYLLLLSEFGCPWCWKKMSVALPVSGDIGSCQTEPKGGGGGWSMHRRRCHLVEI